MLAQYCWWAFANYMLVRSQDIVTRNPDDPEPKPKLTTPDAKSDQWLNFRDGAAHTGLLFAGRNEFNWIVDIRVDELDQIFWAIGNLITNKKVLTTCRASKILMEHGTPNELRINFATQYLWEMHVRKGKKGDNFDALGISGQRLIDVINLHPKCDLDVTVLWDTSIIQLKEDVIPYLPGMGFVFFPSSEKDGKEGALCYVGTLGRKYYNWDKERLIDHKIKYRVYIADWQTCFSAMTFMFDDTMDKQTYREPYSKEDAKTLKCYESRAKVGSVCDYDRGAPVICDNELTGLVTRGADFHHCNNLLHLPFFVVERDGFIEYFGKVFENTRSDDSRSSSDNLVGDGLLLNLIFFLYLLVL